MRRRMTTTVAQTVDEAKNYDLVVIHTSTPSLRMDARTAESIKAANPDCIIAFVGGHPTARPEEVLKLSNAIDIAGRKEFDHSMVEVAQGMDWSKIGGISYRRNGAIHHNPDRPDSDRRGAGRAAVRDRGLRKEPRLPEVQQPVLPVSVRLDVHGARMPGEVHVLPVAAGDAGTSAIARAVPRACYEEVSQMKAKFPKMKELFFDDDTFTADPARARKIAQLLKPLGITWSTNSRANVDYETLKIMKDGGLAPVRGRLRNRQRADSEEHQEGRGTRARAPLHQAIATRSAS